MTTPLDLAVLGGGVTTIKGSLDVSNGHLRKGAKEILTGAVVIDMGSRSLGLDPARHTGLMRGHLCAGMGAVCVQGALRLRAGVKQRKVAEVIRGGLEVATGMAGAVFVYGLDARIIKAAHEAALLGLSSCLILKFGFKDLATGAYRPGIYKILVGASGIACAGYHLYSTCKDAATRIEPLSEEHLAFLSAHKEEIEEMYENKRSRGSWERLGWGISKTAYTHPELPGMLIKIPNGKRGFRAESGEDDLKIHYANLQEIRGIARPFDRIVLPSSHLFPTDRGLILVEQKFDFRDSLSIDDEAMSQFTEFRRAADLCDIVPEEGHNAGLLDNTTPDKIGIIDFDCRGLTGGGFNPVGRALDFRWDWDFRNPGSRFFHPGNRNQVFALVVAAGGSALAGVSKAARKVAKIEPRSMLKIGLGAGVAASAFCASRADMIQPAFTMFGTGVAMIAASVVTPAVTRAWDWVTRNALFFLPECGFVT
ncbi:MAG TPA: hypothetical protein VLF94_04645 [Chlamydiales bacterium]|nr:hypothetical protein [Chlamydiales bacterium]